MSRLTLSIINFNQLRSTVIARHAFDVTGGTIGSAGASWVINDRDHSVAPIHCEIRWIEGSFCVIDRCHRTYLNDGIDCLGSLPPRRLQEGDRLRIGTYQLLVQFVYEHTDLRSLEDLFTPDNRVLERLMADAPAQAWAPGREKISRATDIFSVFEPSMGKDPMAALDAVTDTTPSIVDPLHPLITGERL